MAANVPTVNKGFAQASRKAPWIMLVLAVFVLTAVIGYEIYLDHERVRKTARERLLQQVNVVQQNLAKRLQTTSNALDAIRADFRWLLSHSDGKNVLVRRLEAMVASMIGVRSFLLVNVDGEVISSNKPELIGLNFREGARYKAIRQGADPQTLYLSAPFTTPTGTYAMAAGKMIADEQGRFAGYVLAILEPDFFRLLLHSVLDAQDLRGGIYHADGQRVFEVPRPAGETGAGPVAASDPGVRHFLDSGERSTVTVDILKSTGAARLVAFGAIWPESSHSDNALVVAISRDLTAVFAPWRQESIVRGGLLLAIAVLATVGMVAYQRRQLALTRLASVREAERTQAEMALRESEARLRLALEAAGMLAWEYDPASGKVAFSGKTEEVLQLSDGLTTSAQGYGLIHPGDVEHHRARVDRALATGQSYVSVYRHRRGESAIWLEEHGQAVRDAAGKTLRLAGVVQNITARKQAEMALAEERARLHLLIEHAPAALAMFDRDMRYIACSRRWSADFALGAEDLIGRSHYEVFPDIPARWREIHRRALAGETCGAAEDRFERADGSVQWLHWEVCPWSSIEGEVRGIAIFSEDITARKQAEHALQASEARLRLALDAARAGAWEWDLETQENTWSPELWALYGLTPDGSPASYERWRESIHPDDLAHAEQVVREASAAGAEFDLEWRVLGSGNPPRWLFSRGRPQRESNGRVARYIGIVIDITTRKAAEDALRQTSATLEAALGAMSDAVFITDGHGQLLQFNGGFVAFHRFSSRDACAKSLAEYSALLELSLRDGTLVPLEQWPVPRALRGESVDEAEYHIQLKNSGERWIGSYNFAPICDAQGDIVGSVVTARDITARKQAELSLHRYQQIVDTASEMLCYVDREQRFQVVNPAFAAFYGGNPRSLQEHSVAAVVGEALYACIGPELDATLRGEARRFEVQTACPDGKSRVLETSHTPFRVGADVQGVVVALHDVTEARAAQAALEAERASLEARVAVRTAELQRSEAKLRTIFDLLPIGLSITDPDGRLVDCNRAAETLLGLTRDEQFERAYDGPEWRLLRPDGSLMPVEEYASVRALRDGRIVRDVEMGIERPHGITWLSVSAMPANHPDYGVVVVFADITAHRHAETTLRQISERLQLATEAGGIGVWEWEIPTGRVIWDDRSYRLGGFEPGSFAVTYAAWRERVHPDDIVAVEADIARALETETPFNQEFRVCWPDGSIHWAASLGKLIRDAAGEPLRMIGINWDKTPRKQIEAAQKVAEQALITERQRLQNVIDGTRAGTWEWRIPTGEVAFNERWAEIVGYRLAELEPLSIQSWIDLVHPDDRKISDERLEAHFAGLSPYYECEARMRHKSGHWIWVADRGTVISWTPEGRPLLMSGTHQDITALKHAQEAAEQAARLKATFLANMSHEIRTPLNAILGQAQLLETEVLSPDQRHRVKRMRSAGRSLLGLINDILDVSKLESGQFRLESRPFSPAAILAQVESLLGQQAHAKGLAFSIDAPPDLAPWLLGDALRFEQILSNLIGNAAKFTERGSIRLAIAQQCVEAAVRLRIEVHDTGIGIAAEQIPLLGTAFTQADGSIARRFGGTGLGLTITKQLVARMGGRFGVESTPGCGSTFWFELPFERVTDEAIPVVSAASPTASLPPGRRLNGVRCLVVDDSASNLEVVERMLLREGARVSLAHDGAEALERLRAEHDLDAVLMDIQMPVMDGLEATRAIRGTLGLTALPIIACSAGVLTDERSRAHEAGTNDFLAKPVDLEDLVNVLSRWTAPNPPANLNVTIAPAMAAFPAIAGIDAQRAAQRLNGDWAFFLRLAHLFTSEYDEAVGHLRRELDQGERAGAARYLHHLRGFAGNLSAVELVQATRTLETTLADPQADPTPQLADFEAQLKALLAGLAPFHEVSDPSLPTVDTPLDEVDLASLRDALARRNLAAMGLFERLRPALARQLGAQAAQRMAEAIEKLRFDDALALLGTGITGMPKQGVDLDSNP